MAFIDKSDGGLSLGGGLRLYAGEPMEELLEDLAILSDTDEAPPEGPVLPFPPCPVRGARLAPVCVAGEKGLRAVTLWPMCPEGGKPMTSSRQRAYLFACLDVNDPCPDSMRPVIMKAGFGTAIISADTHTGQATLQIRYRL